MNKHLVYLLSPLLLAAPLVFAAGTVTEYSRDLPSDYRHSYTRFDNCPGSLFGPRIAWAAPHVLGKLKLLIVLPWDTVHEAAELRSRIPADISLITVAGHDKWVNSESREAVYEAVPAEALLDTAHRLLSPGYRYDAILIGKIQWSVIPPVIRNKILSKVKGGTALVWISPWDVDEALREQMALSDTDNALAESIRTTVPLDILPLNVDFEETSPESYFPRRIGPIDIRTGKLGGGNVVWLDYRDRAIKPAHAEDKRTIHGVDPWRLYAGTVALTPFLADDDLYYDYYYSILGKALYHAAGKTTAARLRAQETVVTVERQKLPAAPVAFAVSLANPELRDWSLVYELRDRHGRVLQKGPVGDVVLSDGVARFAPALPRLSQGTYVVDVWALQRGGVLDWASAALVVTDTKVIEAVEPAREAFARTDHIHGTITFATPPPDGLSTAVELWDTHDRLVAATQLEKDSNTFDFSPIATPLSRAYRLVAKVQEKDFVIDQADAWVGLPADDVDDYQFNMWAHAIKTRANRTIMRQCKQHAVTGYYDLTLWMGREQVFESADELAQNNLLANPYSCHLGLEITPDRPLAKTVDQMTNWVTSRVEAYRRYGTMAYSTVEECHIIRKDEAWDNPEALKDYRIYLKQRYADVTQLNAVWGSTFADVEQITPISFVEAKTTRQPTRWLEQELHKVDRLNRVYELIYQAVQDGDPGARMSFDCISGMDFDWPRMAKIVRSYTQCPLESFRKDQGNLAGTWIGYYLNNMDEWIMRITPWQYLFHGGTHVTWWPVRYAFTADLSEPMLCMQQAAEECRELQSGPGRLLLASRKRLDPILLLWSNTSYYAGIFSPGEVGWKMARERFDTMLRRVGLDYQAVGADFIESSLAYGDTQRVLILPASPSISRQGVAKIKAFAEAGGVVVADFPPAVVDEYLRPYGQSESAGAIEFEACARCRGEKRVEVGHVWQACPACGGTGQIMQGGGAPTNSLLADLFDFDEQGAKRMGKGYGLFLKGSPNRREEWGALRKSLVENGGLRGDVEVLDPLGNPRTDVRSYVFDNGRAVFLGLLPDRALNNPPGEDLTVKVGRKAHVYDVRLRQYLGETDAVRTGILPAEAKLLAFLPERIEALNVAMTTETGRPGDCLELTGALLPASLGDSRLVVRIEVSRDGKVQEAYTENLAFQGRFTYPIPLALNQAEGAYHARVMDVISGYTQEVAFTVK